MVGFELISRRERNDQRLHVAWRQVASDWKTIGGRGAPVAAI
jgi:hypothetical protein